MSDNRDNNPSREGRSITDLESLIHGWSRCRRPSLEEKVVNRVILRVLKETNVIDSEVREGN